MGGFSREADLELSFISIVVFKSFLKGIIS